MYGECERSQDKKIVMVSIRKGPQERRCGTKRRDEEKSATQEENRNIDYLPRYSELQNCCNV